MNLEGISTRDLIEELSKREGVNTIIAEPYKEIELKVDGPAIMLEIKD